MIITIVTDVLGMENNGTTITAKRLISNLKDRGHVVRVVSPLESSEEGYYQLGKRTFGILDEYIKRNGVELAKVDYDVLDKAIIGADVVHIILPFQVGRAAMHVALEYKVPFTTAFHCQAENITAHINMKDFDPANRYVYYRFYKKFYRYVHFVHCPSPFIARVLKEHGYNMDLRCISNGVAPEYHIIKSEKPDYLKDKFCIIFVGRLSKEKRHDLLIKAVKRSKYQNKIQLIFAGNGPLERKITNQGKKLLNKPIIAFHKQEELIKILNYCDLYVHPADIEIEAISCLEAISCGLVPIISDSSRSATNSFALNDNNLFIAGNSKDLTKKIEFIIENPDEVIKLKEQYKQYASDFEIAKCIDKMEVMFNDAIKYYKENI